MSKIRVLMLGALLPLCAFADSVPPGWSFDREIAYGSQSRAQRLDILHPLSHDAPRPAVIHIHGGGWQQGDQGGEKTFALLRRLAHEGYIGVSIGYRLSDEAKFPAAVEDCKLAVRWLRAHAATYGIDPGRIGALGASAGGHLAAMLAVAGPEAGLEGSGGCSEQSSAIGAAVPICAPLDLRAPLCAKYGPDDPLVRGFLGNAAGSVPDLARKASPIAYARASLPPMLFIHGTADARVEPSHTLRMVAALKEAGARAELLLVEKGGHGMGIAREEGTLSSIIDFFNRTLKAAG